MIYQVKIKLRNYDTVIYNEEHIQEVRYTYSIDDSTGLLEIYLTIPEDADPVEYFVLHVKDLYKGYNCYYVYHSKYKYSLLKNNKYDFNYQLHKIKMW